LRRAVREEEVEERSSLGGKEDRGKGGEGW